MAHKIRDRVAPARDREEPTPPNEHLAEVHLRHLRYFVVAAEEENFSRAAERLNIVQPALSRRMRDLEQTIGAKLFDRDHKRVRLSLAGRALLDDARQMILDFARATARCRRLSRAETSELSIGINDSALRHEALSRAFTAFHNQFPEVNLRMGPTAPVPLFDAIASGLVDGAFIYTRPHNDPAFSFIGIARDSFQIALPVSHPLAVQSSVRLRDLRDEEFLWLPRESAPRVHDRMLRACEAGGLNPRIQQHILSETSRLHLVAQGLGVTFVTAAFADFHTERVVLLPVVDFDVDLILEFVWRQDNQSPFLQNFADIVNQMNDGGLAGGKMAGNKCNG